MLAEPLVQHLHPLQHLAGDAILPASPLRDQAFGMLPVDLKRGTGSPLFGRFGDIERQAVARERANDCQAGSETNASTGLPATTSG
jgi:hypothetical protein